MAARLVRREAPCMQFGAHIFGVGALAEPATLALVHQLAAPGVHHLMVPVCSFDRDKVLQRLEHIATQVIHPYQRGA